MRAVLDQDDVQRPLRRAASILATLEAIPRERAVAVCAREAYFRSYRAESVKRIVAEGLDAQPLPGLPSVTPLYVPRFARAASAFGAAVGVNRESH